MYKIFLTEKQLAAMTKLVVSNNRQAKEDRLLMHLAINTGLRACDLATLERETLYANGKPILVLTRKMQKTGRIISIPLRADTRKAISNLEKYRADNNPWVFINHSKRLRNANTHAHPEYLARKIKSYLALLLPEADHALLYWQGIHTIRRSVAKIIREKAGAIEPVTAFLGHTSIASTIAYIDMGIAKSTAEEVVFNLDLGG